MVKLYRVFGASTISAPESILTLTSQVSCLFLNTNVKSFLFCGFVVVFVGEVGDSFLLQDVRNINASIATRIVFI